MSHLAHFRKRNFFTARSLFALALIFAMPLQTLRSEDRVSLLPNIHSGQMLSYEVRGKVSRKVKTQSRVATMVEPKNSEDLEVSAILLLTIKEVRKEKDRASSVVVPVVVGKVEFLPLPTEAPAAPPPATAPANHTVQFTIARDGQLSAASGYDDLPADQQLLWQFWFARFAFPWTLPPGGVKAGEKWKIEEAEKSPSPIANIFWERESTYGQNDKCPITPADRCAVFLTTAKLKQKSSTEDSTPESFRLHQLKTSGTVKGSNEIITYLSLSTGLLDRASEDLAQSMDVYIIKEDDTNQVHYTIDVNSHFEAVILPATPAKPR
jgi:hypothetical protein